VIKGDMVKPWSMSRDGFQRRDPVEFRFNV
jgi:hypothetical protein